MEWEAFLGKLQALEGGEELARQLTPHIEEVDGLRTKLTNAEGVVNAIGERDVGTVIGLYDLMVKEGFDSADKINEIKTKSAGLEQSITERDESIRKLQEDIDNGKTIAENATAKAENTLLLADVKTALVDHIGDKKGFDIAIKEMQNDGLFTRSEDGKGLMYGKEGNRINLDKAVEVMRDEYAFAFKEKPGGTGNPPKQRDDRNQGRQTEVSRDIEPVTRR